LGTPRCTKDLIEEALFERGGDLFSEVGLVFFDTIPFTSKEQADKASGITVTARTTGPILRQMVVGVALDVEGRPICCEM
jgi:hypothetical protein